MHVYDSHERYVGELKGFEVPDGRTQYHIAMFEPLSFAPYVKVANEDIVKLVELGCITLIKCENTGKWWTYDVELARELIARQEKYRDRR